MNTKNLVLSAALCGVFIPCGVTAAEPVESASIEGLDVDLGETEIELQTSFLDLDEGTDIEFQLQSETRLSKRLSIGGEFEASREADEKLIADSLLLQVKLHVPLPETSRFGTAIRLGAGYDFGEDRPLSEAILFAGVADERWSLATRFGVEALLGRSASPEVDYRVRLERELGRDFGLGIEAAGDIAADEGLEHRIGPIFSFPLGRNDAPSLELGLLKGLSSATPDIEFRVELEFEF
jgi:hypothetical protein